MTTEITCYTCQNQATSQCPRCGRLYCDEHGDALCAVCLDPTSAVPSAIVYRGSLVALAVATGLAGWLLLLAPTGGATESPPAVTRATATPTAPLAVTTPPPTSPTPTPAVTAVTSSASPTPTSAAPSPTGTPRPGTPTTEAQRYIVQPGDSLSAIAARFKPLNENVIDFTNRLARFNNLDPERSTLSVGQAILIPPPQ